jgi:small subunit ribosomal protein S4e
VYITAKKIPVLTTHDGRTIRYPPPAVKVHDVVKVDLESGKIVDSIKFDVGMTCMITKGRNTGRVGTIVSVEKHPGSFDIVAVRDASNHQFATRLSNIFIVGKDDDLQVSLPKGKGVKLSILEERKKRFKDKY